MFSQQRKLIGLGTLLLATILVFASINCTTIIDIDLYSTEVSSDFLSLSSHPVSIDIITTDNLFKRYSHIDYENVLLRKFLHIVTLFNTDMLLSRSEAHTFIILCLVTITQKLLVLLLPRQNGSKFKNPYLELLA